MKRAQVAVATLSAAAAVVLAATTAALGSSAPPPAAPSRPPALADAQFYALVLGSATSGPMPSGAQRRSIVDRLPEQVYLYLKRSEAPVAPVAPIEPSMPRLANITRLAALPESTFAAPLPKLPTSGLSGLSCNALVKKVNGDSARCVDQDFELFRDAAGSVGGQVIGLTLSRTGRVYLANDIPPAYLLSVALHERGHQLVDLHCWGERCQQALLKATGNSGRRSLSSGPYFTRAHESAAESYAICHGAIPDRRYRIISCAALEKALALETSDRAEYDRVVEANDLIFTSNQQLIDVFEDQHAAWEQADRAYRTQLKLYPLEARLWQLVHGGTGTN
jgi:hypothetical protein